jgi:hypothetical protein
MPRTYSVAVSLLLAGAVFATASSVEAAVVAKQWAPRPGLPIARQIVPGRIVPPVRPLPVIVRRVVPTPSVPPLVPSPGRVPVTGTIDYLPTGLNVGRVTPPVPPTPAPPNCSSLKAQLANLNGEIAEERLAVKSFAQVIEGMWQLVSQDLQTISMLQGTIGDLQHRQGELNDAANVAGCRWRWDGRRGDASGGNSARRDDQSAAGQGECPAVGGERDGTTDHSHKHP